MVSLDSCELAENGNLVTSFVVVLWSFLGS